MLPQYLIKRTPKTRHIRQLRELIADDRVHTVCESAKCPNIGECFSRQTMTFMILGDICTRNCAFCGVSKGLPLLPDPTEPERVAAAVKKLGLDYVVVTSVTRDDLPDGGAEQFAKVINELRMSNSESCLPAGRCRTEVLIPDFFGNENALKTVLDAGPYVLNHNVETIPRLYPKIRPQADFHRSLDLLLNSKKVYGQVYTKSGFMVGLGEKKDEVFALLEELKKARVDIVTIGQYLSPSRDHLRPERFVEPEEFAEYEKFDGLKVFAGPFVRSSYRAKEVVS